jgi:hypothetical protein
MRQESLRLVDVKLTGKTIRAKTLCVSVDHRAKVHRRLLLAGVSALALLLHTMPADALCLRCAGGGVTSATTAAASSAITSAQQAAAIA